MANTLFPSGKSGFALASQAWVAGSVPGTWVPYIIGSWNVDFSKTVLSDIPAAVWRARGTYLTGLSVGASAICDAADTLIGGVGSAGSATAVAIVLVNETGASQTSLLLAYVDTATGFPFLPNGGDVPVAWDNGVNKIFQL